MLVFLLALAAAQTCSGVSYLTGNSGRVVSNTGPEYAGSTYCAWYITPSDPAVRSILIEFDYFDSEMYYDVLVFQDGPNGWYDPQLRWFSGLCARSHSHALRVLHASARPRSLKLEQRRLSDATAKFLFERSSVDCVLLVGLCDQRTRIQFQLFLSVLPNELL
jgi:hypothetical protein